MHVVEEPLGGRSRGAPVLHVVQQRAVRGSDQALGAVEPLLEHTDVSGLGRDRVVGGDGVRVLLELVRVEDSVPRDRRAGGSGRGGAAACESAPHGIEHLLH
jgi:hypothetical protein